MSKNWGLPPDPHQGALPPGPRRGHFVSPRTPPHKLKWNDETGASASYGLVFYMEINMH